MREVYVDEPFLFYDATRTTYDLLGDVIDDDDSMSSSIVAGGDGAKPFLTGCVPLKNPNTHIENGRSQHENICPFHID